MIDYGEFSPAAVEWLFAVVFLETRAEWTEAVHVAIRGLWTGLHACWLEFAAEIWNPFLLSFILGA